MSGTSPDGVSRGVPVQDSYDRDEVTTAVVPVEEPAKPSPPAKKTAKKRRARARLADGEIDELDDDEEEDAPKPRPTHREAAATPTLVRELGS